MRNFTLQLNNPPRGLYFPGMAVSGTVIAENDEAPKHYRSIMIVLDGGARVNIQVGKVTYIRKESYIHCHRTLWDKDRDAAGGLYPLGTRHYQFSLPLVAPTLPASHETTGGYIRYEVVATLHKEGVLTLNQKASTRITVANVVATSHPLLLQPRMIEVQKTVCCLCCASGPIIITATVPRTGYCIGHDSIPLEVTIENGSSRSVRYLKAAIVQTTTRTARNEVTRSVLSTVSRIASHEPIAPHTTLLWQPLHFEVPHVEATSANSSILNITYAIKVSGSIRFGLNPKLAIPIVLGNTADADIDHAP